MNDRDEHEAQLDVAAERGTVLLLEFVGLKLKVSHRMTPAKARRLAGLLGARASEAEAQMPEVPR